MPKEISHQVVDQFASLSLLGVIPWRHLDLRCYIVIELKVGEFEPEYAGN
jgi:hypothetical protein